MAALPPPTSLLAASDASGQSKPLPGAPAADLTDSVQAGLVVESTEQHFGRIDIVVNNAGMTSVADPAEGHADAVPLGHKVAMRDIASGRDVIEYGRVIGVATRDAARGSHVHTHCLATKRWKS